MCHNRCVQPAGHVNLTGGWLCTCFAMAFKLFAMSTCSSPSRHMRRSPRLPLAPQERLYRVYFLCNCVLFLSLWLCVPFILLYVHVRDDKCRLIEVQQLVREIITHSVYPTTINQACHLRAVNSRTSVPCIKVIFPYCFQTLYLENSACLFYEPQEMHGNSFSWVKRCLRIAIFALMHRVYEF